MTVYPTALNTDLEIPRVDNNITEVSSDSINAIRDAIFSIEGAVGISPQGNKTSLAERVSVSLDSNGKLKSSAVLSAGLIALPISNSQISSTAAIAETKLDLDFGTSTLSSRVDGTVVNITANETSINTLFAADVAHYAGTTGRHDGYEVDLRTNIRGESLIESAINALNSAFIVHENYANGIFEVINIAALNAITEDISEIRADIIDGRDRLNDSAITTNERGEQGTQGNLIDTTLASTIFQTDTAVATNILQVMRPNVARVSGKIPDLGGLIFNSKDKLRIQAGGVDRDPLDVDLGSPSIIPTDDMDEVVAAINTEAQSAANHYPISAYNVNGRLVIAHNLSGIPYTISIETIAQSAHVELGFEDVLSTDFNWSDGYHGVNIGGNIITDMKPLLRIRYSHAGGDTITPLVGNLLTLFGVSSVAEGRIICNILDHSVTGSNNNGTYYVQTLTASTIQLNTTVPAGEFDIDIVADSVNFSSTSDEKIYDVFIEAVSDGYDGYGLVTKSLRAQYLSIAGMAIKTVNKTFPTSGTITWRVVGNDTLLLTQNGQQGTNVSIPNGFRGQLQAFMPDNINSALFEVTGNPSSSTKSITPSEFSGTDDRVYLSSVHHPLGTDILQYVMDKRQIGVSTEYQDELEPDSPENSLRDLRNNGIIRGFDVISSTSTTIRIRGGRAVVDGKILDVETKNVTIDSFNSEFRLLALDRNGMYKAFDAYEAGYTTAELNADGYGDARPIATIVDFGTTSTVLTGSFVDRRFFINKIDGRLAETEDRLDNRIDQLESSVGGIMWGFVLTSTTEPPGEFISSIGVSSNPGFRFLEEPGFGGIQTTRRYEFIDPNTDAYSVFKPPGLTHINVMLEVEYSDTTGSAPFGVSGTTNVQVGADIVTGQNDGYSENYVTVKTMETTILPSNSVIERYVASIPASLFNLGNDTIFDIVPRIRIIGSTYVDGGGGGGTSPVMKFGKVRVIVSSYSIAGNVSSTDGTSASLATNLGNVL